MINNHNVSAYNGLIPKKGASRFINEGPIYDKQKVMELCARHALTLWTENAIKDARFLTLEIADLSKYIQKALTVGKYENSQWCQQKECGPWAACDSYEVEITRYMLPEMKEIPVKFYLKFAISKAGNALLSISNHKEGS